MSVANQDLPWITKAQLEAAQVGTPGLNRVLCCADGHDPEKEVRVAYDVELGAIAVICTICEEAFAVIKVAED